MFLGITSLAGHRVDKRISCANQSWLWAGWIMSLKPWRGSSGWKEAAVVWAELLVPGCLGAGSWETYGLVWVYSGRQARSRCTQPGQHGAEVEHTPTQGLEIDLGKELAACLHGLGIAYSLKEALEVKHVRSYSVLMENRRGEEILRRSRGFSHPFPLSGPQLFSGS